MVVILPAGLVMVAVLAAWLMTTVLCTLRKITLFGGGAAT
jgi:hypothetical protein